MRRKTIALSQEEYDRLSEYKQKNYPEGVPFGAVIDELVENSE